MARILPSMTSEKAYGAEPQSLSEGRPTALPVEEPHEARLLGRRCRVVVVERRRRHLDKVRVCHCSHEAGGIAVAATGVLIVGLASFLQAGPNVEC